jgi:hypothetical protein
MLAFRHVVFNKGDIFLLREHELEMILLRLGTIILQPSLSFDVILLVFLE